MASSQNSGVNLFSIADPKIRAALKLIQDKLDAVQGASGGTSWRGDVDAAARKLTNLGAGVADTDAVTMAQLRAATDKQVLATALGSGGTNPINITNLPGSGGVVTFGTHNERLATPAVSGAWFYETDRTALYAATESGVWVLVASMQFGSPSDRPADLTENDVDYLYFQQGTDGNIVWSWNGQRWFGAVGQQNGLIANIPAADTSLIGTYYYATDFDRLYLCDSPTTWADAPGQPAREMIGLFTTAPGTGWHLCDGTAGVPISTAGGGTSTITVPNLTGATTWMTAGAATGTGTFAAVGVNYPYATYLPYIRL